MTLKHFLEDHQVYSMEYEGSIMVSSRHPDLWHLTDYVVSSAVSCGVILVKR